MPTPASLVRFEDLTFSPRFAYGDQAQVVEVSGNATDTPLGTGFARFTNADIPWTVQYDEVVLVLEGTMSVHTDDVAHHLGPKDSMWLPKGTQLRYVSASALVFYSIHPANWAEANQ